MTDQGVVSLCAILKAAGGKVAGMKKLQKLVYLANEAGYRTPHAFRYHYYGVYSFDVENDVTSAAAAGVLKVQQDASPDARRDFELADQGSVVTDPKDPGLKLAADLAREEARTLEVLSTIVYVRSLGIEGDGLKRKVRELKGHIPDTPFHKKAWELFAAKFPQAN